MKPHHLRTHWQLESTRKGRVIIGFVLRLWPLVSQPFSKRHWVYLYSKNWTQWIFFLMKTLSCVIREEANGRSWGENMTKTHDMKFSKERKPINNIPPWALLQCCLPSSALSSWPDMLQKSITWECKQNRPFPHQVALNVTWYLSHQQRSENRRSATVQSLLHSNATFLSATTTSLLETKQY